MASKQSIERTGGEHTYGTARSEKNDEETDDDASVVSAAREFLAAQTQCARTNVEASFGATLLVSPGVLGYDLAHMAREDALLRLRRSPARGLQGLEAKRKVLLTLIGWLGNDDPKIFEYATELVEEYHAVLVTVWPAEDVRAAASHAQ